MAEGLFAGSPMDSASVKGLHVSMIGNAPVMDGVQVA
jgi:hypothetical protein